MICERAQSTVTSPVPATAVPAYGPALHRRHLHRDPSRHHHRHRGGLRRLFRQFPPSRAEFPPTSPRKLPVPSMRAANSGYALPHAYGAAFDNPDLPVAPRSSAMARLRPEPWRPACIPTSSCTPSKTVSSYQSCTNGYKIANWTVLDRILPDELRSLMIGYGHNPYFFEVADDNSRPPMPTAASPRYSTRSPQVATIRPMPPPGMRPGCVVADDRLPHPEGLDWPRFIDGCKKTTAVASASGPAGQCATHRSTAARRLVGLLPTGRNYLIRQANS